MSNKIPKRIIQQGGADLPIRCKAAMANLKLLNPDYEYLFFDDEKIHQFVNTEFKQYLHIFNSFRFPIQKWDFFRYLAVYRLGGFYFDLDVFLASRLDDLLTCGCVFPFEEITVNSSLWEQYGIDWEIGNFAFGAAAGHPFIQAVIDNCVRAQSDPQWVTRRLRGVPYLCRRDSYVLYSTGPGLVTWTLAETPQLKESVHVLFPQNIYDPRTWNHFGRFGVHMMDGSWRGRKGLFHRKLVRLSYEWGRAKTRRKARGNARPTLANLNEFSV